jgi:ABC-2 type transport system ATP-binding protein
MIEVQDLTKRFGTTVAVEGLSFQVRPGMVTGFLGPNGSGKSTTMRMILGLDRPTAGTAVVNGRPYQQHRRPLYEVGALLDAAAIHGGRTAYHHLLVLAQSNGIPRFRARAVLDRVGLTEVAGKRAGTFSLGMRQRLGVAAALLGDPRVLMFDEPVNGLDPEGILWIRTMLKALAAEGRTVFVSSHLMSEMALTADHLVVIGRGRLIADTSVEEFVHRSADNHVRVRTPDRERMLDGLHQAGAVVRDDEDGALAVTGVGCADVGDIAALHNVTLHELSLQQVSLEAAFMEVTRDSVDFRSDVGSGAQVPGPSTVEVGRS